MPYASQTTAQNVPEFVPNEISVFWYGTLQVGTILFPANSGPGTYEGTEEDISPSTVTYTEHPTGSWPVINGSTYPDSRQGWIKLKDNLGVLMYARVIQGQDDCSGTTVMEVLELNLSPSIDFEADLLWDDLIIPGFLFQNAPRIIIAGVTHILPYSGNLLVDVPDSGIVTFNFRHNVTAADLSNTLGGTITMSAEIKDGGNIVAAPASYNDSTTTARDLSVSVNLDMDTINNQTLDVRLISEDVGII